MKILIIDDSPDFRALIRLYLSKELDSPELTDYEAEKKGRPAPDFDWSRFDVLLLDYRLGGGEDGLRWLMDFGERPGFPPTIVLTAEGNEYVALKAVKLGAANYITKQDITPKRIASLVREAAEFSPDRRRELERQMELDTEIVSKIKHERELVPGQGKEIGYRFVRMIGEGAMSKVYLAERIRDNLTMVLKILDLSGIQDEILITRFLQEAELIEEVDSPFVVKIYDHGLTERYGFIAMEFFSRGDLKQRLELKLNPEIIFIYMIHICYGLDAIHRIGVIHRDLKPANIMFRGDDSLALADFGISKKLEGGRDITSIGQVLGTPNYMSPEQGEARPLDARSDLYSAGVMLYELLTGSKPFVATSASSMIYQHISADIPRLPTQLSRYQFIIDKAMAKDPDDRYQSASEFIHVLEAAEQGQI